VVDLIELDGNPHSEYYKIHEDEIRDKYLESYGFYSNKVLEQIGILGTCIQINHPGRYRSL
jgi:very-short-patch-repair endonuclease